MQVIALKTPIIKAGQTLRPIINASIREQFPDALPERSVIVVTSKIIAYEQGRLVPITSSDEETNRAKKHDLVRQEADLYLEPQTSRYHLMMTVTDATLTVNAGIDESNADGNFILWPENLYAEAEKIWQNLRQDFGVKEVGVIITDSRSFPFRWGVVGMSLASCGFRPLNNHVGNKDLFGREIEMVQVNVAEALAVASVLEMGEVDEQTPLAIVQEAKMIEFMDRPLSSTEIEDLTINLADDVYEPILNKVTWKKGKKA